MGFFSTHGTFVSYRAWAWSLPTLLYPTGQLSHSYWILCTFSLYICKHVWADMLANVKKSIAVRRDMNWVGLQTASIQEDETSCAIYTVYVLQFTVSLQHCRTHQCTMESYLLPCMLCFNKRRRQQQPSGWLPNFNIYRVQQCFGLNVSHIWIL